MKGTMPSRVISAPLTSPHSAPTPTPPKIPTTGLAPSYKRTAVTTEESAMIEPTDRSMPPATMT